MGDKISSMRPAAQSSRSKRIGRFLSDDFARPEGASERRIRSFVRSTVARCRRQISRWLTYVHLYVSRLCIARVRSLRNFWGIFGELLPPRFQRFFTRPCVSTDLPSFLTLLKINLKILNAENITISRTISNLWNIHDIRQGKFSINFNTGDFPVLTCL